MEAENRRLLIEGAGEFGIRLGEEIVEAFEAWCYDGSLIVEHGSENGKPTAAIHRGKR